MKIQSESGLNIMELSGRVGKAAVLSLIFSESLVLWSDKVSGLRLFIRLCFFTFKIRGKTTEMLRVP